VSTEYLRRNLIVAKAIGAKAGVSKSLKRLEQMSRAPQWLVTSLRGVLERQDPIPEELAKWRDAAADAPDYVKGAGGL
jgi:hypothetical protein